MRIQSNGYKDVKELSENYNELSGKYHDMKQEIEAMNKNQSEMKDIISHINNTLERKKTHNRLHESEDQISKIEDTIEKNHSIRAAKRKI